MSDCRGCSWVSALQADCSSWYWRWGRYVALPFAAAYVAVLLLRRGATVPSASGGYLYTSPEGLQMTLTHPFPGWRVALHSVAAVLLIAACIWQRHSAPRLLLAMQRHKCTAAGGTRTPGRMRDGVLVALRARWRHVKVVGPFILLAMCAMSFAGFSLRSFSTFSNFGVAMIAFVAPWPLLAASVLFSAACGYARAHIILGNSIYYACLAVCLARSLGVLLQRLTPDHLAALSERSIVRRVVTPWTGLGLEAGYYWGIMIAACVGTAVALVDAALFLRRAQRTLATNRGLKAA